jgi:hypothetical protein
MKRIPLTNGGCALVDHRDFAALKPHRWCKTKQGHVLTRIRGKTVYMHTLLARPRHGFQTDHRNGNPFDNRRRNLRVATHSQNMQNRRLGKNNSAGVKGVYFDKHKGKYHARIWGGGKCHSLGYHDSAAHAAVAYNTAARLLYGQFARLNRV